MIKWLWTLLLLRLSNWVPIETNTSKWVMICYFRLLSVEFTNFWLFQGSRVEQEKLLKQSTTLYIGNLAFFTTEEQIHELFSKCGDIKRIIMGLDKYKKTPCGFCFVEYVYSFEYLNFWFISCNYYVFAGITWEVTLKMQFDTSMLLV